MRRRFCSMAVLLAIAIGGSASAGRTQMLPVVVDDEDARHQVTAHYFTHRGTNYRELIKLDRHTGRTWRFHFHAGMLKWRPIPEPTNGPAPKLVGKYRYGLQPLDYQSVRGEPEKLFIRTDSVTGHTWIYRAPFSSWRLLEQEQ